MYQPKGASLPESGRRNPPPAIRLYANIAHPWEYRPSTTVMTTTRYLTWRCRRWRRILRGGTAFAICRSHAGETAGFLPIEGAAADGLKKKWVAWANSMDARAGRSATTQEISPEITHFGDSSSTLEIAGYGDRQLSPITSVSLKTWSYHESAGYTDRNAQNWKDPA